MQNIVISKLLNHTYSPKAFFVQNSSIIKLP